MPLESQLLASITRRLKKLAQADPALQWRKRHGSVFTVSGDPDVFGCWHGHHFEMELKRPGQSPTPLQCARLEAWKRAGAACFVIHSLAEFDVAIDTIRRAALAKMGEYD
ncbi:MAG TPA: hypothetical protein VNW90_25415 [Acetobacteraceae bacterium]|jgi:hypothetical protein|nr:hypothetical protein [Acetobacteraceae bacterium]